MYPVSQHFSDMMKSINRQIGLKIVIDGVEYGNDKIVDLTVEYSLSASEKLTIGTIVASRLNFSIREFEANIAENATVEPYIRFEGGLMWDEAVNEWNIEEATWNFDETEWMPLGKYYVDNRTFTEQRLWEFECYDATVLLHQNYISALTYPQTMRSVLQEVCSQVDIQIANIELINENYQVSLLPTEITLHKVISYIASANCCSAFIDRDGKLKFIKLSSEMYNTPADTITRRDYFKAKRTNDKVVIDTVKLYEKDGFTEGEFSELVRGTGSSHTTLNLVNPFMDEDILDDVYNTLNGFEYIPYELDYKCFPNLEIGDVVTIEQSVGSSWLETTETWGNADFAWDRDIISFNVIVLYNKITYKGGLRSTLKADSESQQTSEFKVKGSLRQYIENIDKNTIKEGKVYNGVTTSREEGVVVERSDGKAKTIMNATEGISIYSDVGEGLERNFYVDLDGRIKARAIDIDADGTFGGTLTAEALEAIKANIDVVVSNTVITETLYADKGNIADLTVNKLDTSIKVDNYKLRYDEDFATNIEKQQQSVSDVNYIKAYEQHIEFCTGSVKYDEDGVPLTEQATDDKGRPLYWVDNTHMASTYEPNDLPVMIYQYDETIKLSISFRSFGETYEPYIILGGGIGSTLDPDRGKAFIHKDTEGLLITYKKADGTDVYLRLGEDGISLSHDVLSALNFYSNGFIAKYGETQVGYRWTKDVQGRITQLENIYTSEVVPVTWNGGAI